MGLKRLVEWARQANAERAVGPQGFQSSAAVLSGLSLLGGAIPESKRGRRRAAKKGSASPALYPGDRQVQGLISALALESVALEVVARDLEEARKPDSPALAADQFVALRSSALRSSAVARTLACELWVEWDRVAAAASRPLPAWATVVRRACPGLFPTRAEHARSVAELAVLVAQEHQALEAVLAHALALRGAVWEAFGAAVYFSAAAAAVRAWALSEVGPTSADPKAPQSPPQPLEAAQGAQVDFVDEQERRAAVAGSPEAWEGPAGPDPTLAEEASAPLAGATLEPLER